MAWSLIWSLTRSVHVTELVLVIILMLGPSVY